MISACACVVRADVGKQENTNLVFPVVIACSHSFRRAILSPDDVTRDVTALRAPVAKQRSANCLRFASLLDSGIMGKPRDYPGVSKTRGLKSPENSRKSKNGRFLFKLCWFRL